MDAFGGRGEVLHHSTHYRPLWINSYFPNKLSVRITITVPEKYARCFIYSFNLPNNSGKPVFVFPSQRKNKALKSTLLQILQRFLVCVFGEEERMSPSPSSNTACPLWSYLDGRRLQISFIFQRVLHWEKVCKTQLCTSQPCMVWAGTQVQEPHLWRHTHLGSYLFSIPTLFSVLGQAT